MYADLSPQAVHNRSPKKKWASAHLSYRLSQLRPCFDYCNDVVAIVLRFPCRAADAMATVVNY
jgi:hypothetical protein